MLRKSQKISNENIRAIYTKIAMLENAVNLFLNKVDIFTFVDADGNVLFRDQVYIKKLYSEHINRRGKGDAGSSLANQLINLNDNLNAILEAHLKKLKRGNNNFPSDDEKKIFKKAIERLEQTRKKLNGSSAGYLYFEESKEYQYFINNHQNKMMRWKSPQDITGKEDKDKSPTKINRGHIAEGYVDALFKEEGSLGNDIEDGIKTLIQHIEVESKKQIYGGDVQFNLEVTNQGKISINLMVKSFNYSVANSGQYVFLAYNIINLNEQDFCARMENQSLEIINKFYKTIKGLPSDKVIVKNKKTLEQYINENYIPK